MSNPMYDDFWSTKQENVMMVVESLRTSEWPFSSKDL